MKRNQREVASGEEKIKKLGITDMVVKKVQIIFLCIGTFDAGGNMTMAMVFVTI
jgi:hypothetical protein